MEEGERSPLLSQDAAHREPPLLTNRLPTTSHTVPPRGDQVGAWSRRRCPSGAKHQGWKKGLGGGPAPSLPTGYSCLKYLTFVSNFLFSLLALLALAVGLWGLAVKGSLGGSWGDIVPPDPVLVLVLGALAVSTVSLLGCLGALCENSCFLRCFCGAVLFFLVLQALAGVLVAALWGPLQDSLEHTLHVAITHYQDSPDLRFLLDQVQLGLRCCGVASYQDWQQNLSFNCDSPGTQACSLPASCCIRPWEDGALVNTQCGLGALRLDEDAAGQVVHLEGCGPALLLWLHRNIQALGGCAIAIVVVQGAELLLATWLLKALAAHKTVEAVEAVHAKTMLLAPSCPQPGPLPALVSAGGSRDT
uniref:Tetraspanin-10 n=1 Tax=Spermophilus dauricus TaxID=99837 RepID=A0A8C9Q3E6_SPEDA